MGDDCNQSPSNKSKKTIRHIEEPICSVCCQTFSKKSNLKRHNERFHSGKEKKKNVQEKFICEECGQSFTIQSNLMRHKTRLHCENKIIHQFDQVSCKMCGQTFQDKRNLLRHEKSIHGIIIFECETCDKIFRRKDSLTSHKLRAHCVNPEELETYECYHCSKKFFEKHTARKHIINVHMNPKQKSSNVKCVKCDFTCPSKTSVRTHYENAHGIKLKFEELQFETVEKFELWRTEMQRTLVTQFVQQSTSKTSNGLFKRFVCHRSGMYIDLSKCQPRKRQLKNIGSKKLQGFCPAEIIVKIQPDKCSVRFQRVHVGHTISSEEEVRHIYLDKELKKNIASKLLEGVPKPDLLKMYHVPEKLDRLHKLKPRDIWNISQNLRISNNQPVPKSAAAGTENVPLNESFVVRSDSVLFSKNQGEPDRHFGLLKSTDFMMILMNESQAQSLRRYGSKVVAFDSTEKTNALDFILHTLLVIDVNCEILPVAFLLTNRNDRLAIDIFIRCIKDRVGVIKTKTLMSDMQNVYLDSWTSLMEPPQFHQFCAGHVNECWRRNVAKIWDESRRSLVSERLLDLERELDVDLFEQKLNSFVSIRDSSLQDFLTLFKRYFYHTRQQWAYCYRMLAAVPVSIRIKDFRNAVQLSISTDKNVKSTFESLKYLEKFSLVKGSERRICQTEHSNRGEILKENHLVGIQLFETNTASVARLNDGTWQVVSFEGTENTVTELHTIRKIQPKECSLYDDVTCQLYCEQCEICFHEYRCTCLESTLHLDMCKHVHVLGLYLQTHRLLEIRELDSSEGCEGVNSLLLQVHADSLVETALDDDLERVKSQIIEEVREALSFAKELSELELIRSRFIQPMKLKLMDGKVSQ